MINALRLNWKIKWAASWRWAALSSIDFPLLRNKMWILICTHQILNIHPRDAQTKPLEIISNLFNKIFSTKQQLLFCFCLTTANHMIIMYLTIVIITILTHWTVAKRLAIQLASTYRFIIFVCAYMMMRCGVGWLQN